MDHFSLEERAMAAHRYPDIVAHQAPTRRSARR
jgi:hypothetical protein